MWGASTEACSICALFFSISCALGAIVDERALHGIFFKPKYGPGFVRWVRTFNWAVSQAILIALLRVCDREHMPEKASTDITATFVGLTYFDIVFSISVAEHRRTRGQVPDLGMYALAIVPAITYGMFLAYIFIWLDHTMLPAVVATDSAAVFALPMIHSGILTTRVLSYIPSLMVHSPRPEGESEPEEKRMLTAPRIVYAVLSFVLWWFPPPLKVAVLLNETPSKMLEEWRSWTSPKPCMPCGCTPRDVGMLAGLIVLPVLLVVGGLAFYRSFLRTGAFLWSLAKSKRHGRIVEYFKRQDDSETTEAERSALADAYYDLAAEFYEWGWGTSFHFAERLHGESFQQSILRHEYYLAGKLGIRNGAHVLDCGCGIGGPARNIARFTGAQVTGITINQFEVSRGNDLSEKEGIREQVQILQGDFLALPFPDASFDAVYAIESTCHSPDHVAAYREIFRVLRPGGIFVCYEWCLTDGYDPKSECHLKIKKEIEAGDGLPALVHTSVCRSALAEAGFEVLEAHDCAEMKPGSSGGKPWYTPLEPSWSPLAWPGFQMNPIMREVLPALLRLGECARLLPEGAADTQVMLRGGALAVARAGAEGIFTPMWLMVGRKGL